MPTFAWDDQFLTGLPTVDEDHRRLVGLVNHLGALLDQPAGAGPEELEAAFRNLLDCVDRHFSTERRLMEEAGLDPRHQSPHVAEHAAFLEEITRAQREAAGSSVEQLREILAFLARWMVYHILRADQEMAREVAAIRGGCSPAEAFEASGPAHDDAADLLIEGLQGLHRALARRNRQLIDLNASLDVQVAARTAELQDANRALVQVVGELASTRDELRTLATRYRAAVETSMDGFWVADTQGRLLEVNDRYCQLSGYSRDELLGMSIQDLEAQESPEDTARHIGAVLTRGGDLFETLHRAKDGRLWPVEVMATFWPQEGHRLFTFLRDITSRRAAEAALLASEQRFRTLFYDAPVGHALNRLADGWFVAVNETFAGITGHTIDELNALSYWDLTPHEYADQEARQLESLKAQGRYGPYEKEYIHKDGRRIPVLLNGSLVTDPDGTQLILSVVSDISQRRVIEEERESLIGSLQEALEQVHSLSGLLPICSNCKRIRDDGGYWQQIEAFISTHSEASFSHGICPECATTYFPGLGEDKG